MYENNEKKFHVMNDALMEIAKLYIQWHDQERKFGIDEKLFRAEIHTIQTIGNNEGINITDLAKILNITKATVSERISKLYNLKLLFKRIDPANKKEVNLYLSKKGWIAFSHHEAKHGKLYHLFTDHFGNKADDFLTSFFSNISEFSDFLIEVKKEKDFQ